MDLKNRLVLILFLFCTWGKILGKTVPIDTIKSKTQKNDTIKHWKTGGYLTLNLSQVALSNWSGGGENSIAANSLLSLTAKYEKKESSWDNSIDFGFGRLKRGNSKAIKTDDRFDLVTKYGRKIFNKWYYSALFNVKTQIFPGYSYPEYDSIKISDFLSPGYFFLSMGVDFIPNDNFTFLMSPLTGKTTIVKSDYLSGLNKFGVDSGKLFRHEFGGFIKLIKKGSFLKFLSYQLKIDGFSNYTEKPENIDWDCEITVWAKIHKFISANFKTNILYDDDITTSPQKKPGIQIREFVGIGFSYRF